LENISKTGGRIMQGLCTNFRGRQILCVCIVGLLYAAPAETWGQWLKIDPPPDVDKSAFGHEGTETCWMATAANMLAGAGYGPGPTVEQSAEYIYAQMVAEYGTDLRGWPDTAMTWWLGSANNIWPSNPYQLITYYGNKNDDPWANHQVPQILGTMLRNCYFTGLIIVWPRETAGGAPSGGHAITGWGDDKFDKRLLTNPGEVKVTDSDDDTGGNVQTYTWDDYYNPNPGRQNEGDGWYMNYDGNHPYLIGSSILMSTELLSDSVGARMITASYRVHQGYPNASASDLHYIIETNEDILTYKTTLDYKTSNKPVIIKDANPPQELTVDWDLTDNPVPYCIWIEITADLTVVDSTSIAFDDVHFTFPEPLYMAAPGLILDLTTPVLPNTDIEHITGGYLLGSFDVVDPLHAGGAKVVGEFRFQKQYLYDQDPESHQFSLLGDPNLTHDYHITNLKFGHSYGVLSRNELWTFDDWMTRIPEKRILSKNDPITINLDWNNRRVLA